jgi:ABC-type multidrug transport system ATPase subunit/ABC-type multidrug transport system permease subunit
MLLNKPNDLPNHSDFVILLEDVEKVFTSAIDGRPAITQITTRIKRGSITGLVGPDGAGKTTLMRIIAGLLTITKGHLSVEGLDPCKDTSQIRAILGYMPQKFGLYEDLTVIENLVLYADLRGVLEEERTRVFDELLNFTDLKRFTTRPTGKLSGGMKQKLGLACALLGHPKILLLDEPSVGVDPISRRELWKMVKTLIASGITVIWSTSYLDEAELCDEVLLMNEGKLLYSGDPADLTQKMQGRSIQVQHIQGNHRLVLQHALRSKEVIDGVIQGLNVRLVLKEKDVPPDLTLLDAGPEAILVPVEPRFEDGFIDILGGGPGGDSVLTKIMKQVPQFANSDAVIEAVSLTKKFGSFIAANDISFKVERGKIFGLLGPNGAGKSTTFKMMCGLLTPTSGTAKVLGIDLQKSASQARQKIGYMAQKFSLYGDLTVQQNLQFFSGIYGLVGTAQTDRIAAMVQAFNLESFLNTTTNELPLGFKQRLALACAIMHEPAVLFLDEPTSGVDPISRREFWTHINGLVEKGVTVMVTTHFMDEAEYCDQIGLVYQGKLIAIGTPDQLKTLARSTEHPDPTMEDTFINLIMKQDEKNQESATESTSVTMSTTDYLQQNSFIAHHDSIRRWLAMCRKEYFQIVRDPSSILMAFVLPMIMLFIFGFGLNLDSAKIRLGIVMNDKSPDARHFENAFLYSPYIDVIPLENQSDAAKQLTAGNIRGFVMIQPNFGVRNKQPNGIAPVQLITDGAETNTANFVTSYATGAWLKWQELKGLETATPTHETVSIESRYWFNPGAISRYFLVPGSIAIIMTVIGALLTSLVVAREWESGTMEALLSTPITKMEFLLSKLVPYYLLGIISMIVCTLIAVTVLRTPFHGSILLLFILTSLFLGCALGLGLLLSTATRNQFNAAQAALNIAYLPAMMLSGFVYEIHSMPVIVQAVTYLIPARYFVSSLQTLFLAGNIDGLLFKDALFLFVSALIFLGVTYRITPRRLD